MADEAQPDVVASIADGIAGMETGGHADPYATIGRTTPKGDKPYGKYQIMGANVPSWTQEALGRSYTPDEFLKDPDAQEVTAKYRIKQYYDKHGNARDVASLWHSGVPYDQAVRENRKDSVFGNTTQSYADTIAAKVDSDEAPATSAVPVVSDVKIRLPDDTVINLGPNPSPDVQAKVKAKIAEKFPQLDPRFTTKLSTEDETAFQQWKAKYAPNDSGDDYDLRGAFKAGLQPDPATGHWPDTFKKPNHPTFSDQSQYAPLAPEKAGHWNGDTYVPPTPPQPSSTTTTPDSSSATPPMSAKAMRDQTVDQAAKGINQQFGLDDTHWMGKYTAALGKPAADALHDLYEVITRTPTTAPGWRQDIEDALKLLHPLAVPGEAAGNVAFQAAQDAGLPPEAQAMIGTMVGLLVGAKTPLPGGGLGPAAEMPLQGSNPARAAATEAGNVASRGAEWAGMQKVAGEAATVADVAQADQVAVRGNLWKNAQAKVGDEAATAAQQTADAAQTAADAAKTKTVPSTEAKAAADTALTPAGITPEQGGQAIGAGLSEDLAAVKDPVQGIYRAVGDNAAAQARSLDPAKYKDVYDSISAVEGELGPTLTGQAKQVLGDIKAKVDAGEKLTYADVDKYKSQLDTLFPGKTPLGSTPKTAALYRFKWDVRDLMRNMVEGDDREWLDVANSMWRDQVIPKQKLVDLVKKTDPAVVVERLFGTGTSDKQAAMAKRVMGILGDAPSGAGEAVRQAVAARIIGKATNAAGELDPAAMLKTLDGMHGDFVDAAMSPGAKTFFNLIRQQQGEATTAASVAKTATKSASEIAKDAATATAEAEKTAAAGAKTATKAAADTAKQAEGATTTAEGIATKAQTAAEQAAAKAKEPNTLARLTARGLQFAVTETIAKTLGIPVYGAAGIVIPPDTLASLLANNKTANILARSMKTPVNSAVVPTLIQQLKNNGIDWHALSGAEESK